LKLLLGRDDLVVEDLGDDAGADGRPPSRTANFAASSMAIGL
jgi:hypothetical protein